tara:strand:- start:21578 stop:22168 length:591 start_codon:yes stop_codon:yes gene_type:complete
MRFGRYSVLAPQKPLNYTEDGVVFKSGNFMQLTRAVMLHREENGGDLSSGWVSRFGTSYCDSHPDCISCTKDEAPLNRVLTLGEVSAFLRAVVKWIASGKVVDQSEAERRAAICASCPLNVEITNCKSCFKLAEKSRALIGNVSTSLDSNLDGCYACGCNLKVKVWCPSSVVAGTKTDSFYPDYCWQKEGGENYVE